MKNTTSSVTRRMALVCGSLVSLSLMAGPITTLFNTGMDANRALLGAKIADPHYTLIEVPEGDTPGPAYTLQAGFPVGPWLAEGPDSRWIAPQANQSSGNVPGNWTYRTTFDLTGFDPNKAAITGRWVSDNGGVDILINGVNLGLTNPGNFDGWSAANDFTIASGFVEGVNTLDFVVGNAGTDINPTGLRVEMIGTVEIPGEAPRIVTQPKSATRFIGDPVSFQIFADGTPPLTYQWQLNDKDIAAATEPTYSIAAVAATDDGKYVCVVKNGVGTKASDPAILNALELLTGLYNTGVDNDAFVLYDGDVDPHYKLVVNPDAATQDAMVQDSTVFPISDGTWLFNTDFSKWIGPRFETSAAAAGDYVYRLTLDLGTYDPQTVLIEGRWTSDNAGLDVLVNGGSTGVSNTGNFNAWNNFTIATGFVTGVNTIDFKVNNASVGYAGLRVEGIRGGAKKKTVVEDPARIVTEPKSQVAFVGETVTFVVVADGTKPLSYQWRFNDIPLPGKTEPSLVLTNLRPDDTGDYRVRVLNSVGAADSQAAHLIVLEPISGLFNTGVGPTGQLLADGEIDPHYLLVTNAHDVASVNAYAEDQTVWPIVAGPWLLPNDLSKWIGPQMDPNGAGGDYAFRTSFDATGFDPATIIVKGGWASDNVGMDIVVNGTGTGLQNNAQFTIYTQFQINTGFKAGVNTLEFLVNNAGAEANPIGLRIEGIRVGGVRVSSAPTLGVARSSDKVVLSWPVSATGFTLDATPALVPAAWTPVTDPVVVVADQNTVTTATSGSARFFRLMK